MQEKTKQLKFNTSTQEEEIKYFTAFSFLYCDTFFKAKLLEYFNYSAKMAFLADEKDLEGFSLHYDITVPRSFISKRNKLNVDKCFEKAFQDKNIKIVTYNDENYPQFLKHIPDFPLALFYKGNLENIDYNYSLAVVGSRRASTDAQNGLYKILSNFKNSNITIVSGLAYGIDATAHKASLDNNIKTLGVIGSGLDFYYPAQNKYLYDKIVSENGAIISEYPTGTEPIARNFPMRNRIVVGMTKGTLVAEAQMKSGAMISGNLALEYNKELMCIPGNILNPNTQGIYHLIKQGAGIVSTSEDILNIMGWENKCKLSKNDENEKIGELNDTQKAIINEIALEAKSFDEIINNIELDTPSLMVNLTELELLGFIKQVNNRYYKL